jgi:hypothetical protein
VLLNKIEFKRMKTNDVISAIKAARKAAREQEIALYGKTICHFHVERNPKAYTRKQKHKLLAL